MRQTATIKIVAPDRDGSVVCVEHSCTDGGRTVEVRLQRGTHRVLPARIESVPCAHVSMVDDVPERRKSPSDPVGASDAKKTEGLWSDDSFGAV